MFLWYKLSHPTCYKCSAAGIDKCTVCPVGYLLTSKPIGKCVLDPTFSDD